MDEFDLNNLTTFPGHPYVESAQDSTFVYNIFNKVKSITSAASNAVQSVLPVQSSSDVLAGPEHSEAVMVNSQLARPARILTHHAPVYIPTRSNSHVLKDLKKVGQSHSRNSSLGSVKSKSSTSQSKTNNNTTTNHRVSSLSKQLKNVNTDSQSNNVKFSDSSNILGSNSLSEATRDEFPNSSMTNLNEPSNQRNISTSSIYSSSTVPSTYEHSDSPALVNPSLILTNTEPSIALSSETRQDHYYKPIASSHAKPITTDATTGTGIVLRDNTLNSYDHLLSSKASLAKFQSKSTLSSAISNAKTPALPTKTANSSEPFVNPYRSDNYRVFRPSRQPRIDRPNFQPRSATRPTYKRTISSSSYRSHGGDHIQESYHPLSAKDSNSDNESIYSTAKRYFNSRVDRRPAPLKNGGLGKEFWMKDEFVNECFRCTAKFTTFRRKHHCRICGQIFCSKCTVIINTIIAGANHATKMRLCKKCNADIEKFESSDEEYDRQEESGSQFGEDSILADSTSNKISSSYTHNEGFLDSPRIHHGKSNQYMSFDQNFALALEASSDESEDSEDSIPLSSFNSNYGNSRSPSRSQGGSKRHRSGTSLSIDQANSLRIGTRKKSFTARSKPSFSAAANIPPPFFGESIFSTNNNPTSSNTNSAAHIRLNSASITHAKEFLRQVLREQGMSNKLEKWIDALMPPLLQCASHIDLDIKLFEGSDFRSLVKLKRIPGGKPSHSKYIDGVVFSQTLTMKSMPHHISNPRVLLARNLFEHPRFHVATIKEIEDQDRVRDRAIIKRIGELRPNVILTTGNLSRRMIEKLNSMGIAIIANIKDSVINRISRYTQASICTYESFSDSDTKLGRCDSFDVRMYQYRDVVRKYVFLCGIPKELGCTILIRGGDYEVLGHVKKIVQFMVYVIFNLKLETSLLREEYVDVPENDPVLKEIIEKKKQKNTHQLESNNTNTPSDDGDINVVEHEGKILSISPFVDYGVPYLLKVARQSEDKLVAMDKDKDSFSTKDVIINILNSIEIETKHLPGHEETVDKMADFLYRDIYKRLYDTWSKQKRLWEVSYLRDHNMFTPEYHMQMTVLYSSVCTETATPCFGPELLTFSYYNAMKDMPLGHFIERVCMDANVLCSEGCGRILKHHSRSYAHGNGNITVTVSDHLSGLPGLADSIFMWSTCKKCDATTPIIPMSDDTWKYSLGKYFELSFWSTELSFKENLCPHNIYRDHVRFFSFKNLAISFEYFEIKPFEVMMPPLRLSWQPEREMKLKVSCYSNIFESINLFYSSVMMRLKSVKVDELVPETIEQCRANVEELLARAKEEQNAVINDLDSIFINTDPTSYLPLNSVLRSMQMYAISWDLEFAEFENNFFPSEKDITRLTAQHLRRIFLNEDIEEKKKAESISSAAEGSEKPADFDDLNASESLNEKDSSQLGMIEEGETPKENIPADLQEAADSKDLNSDDDETSKELQELNQNSESDLPSDHTDQVNQVDEANDAGQTDKGDNSEQSEPVSPIDAEETGKTSVIGIPQPLSKLSELKSFDFGAVANSAPSGYMASRLTGTRSPSPIRKDGGISRVREVVSKIESQTGISTEDSVSPDNELNSNSNKEENDKTATEITATTEDKASGKASSISQRKPIKIRSSNIPVLKAPERSDSLSGSPDRMMNYSKLLARYNKGIAEGGFQASGSSLSNNLNLKSNFDKIGYMGTLGFQNRYEYDRESGSVFAKPEKRYGVSDLTRHFEQVFQEFDNNRVQKLRTLEKARYRAVPVTTSKPIVEVYQNVNEAVEEELSQSDDSDSDDGFSSTKFRKEIKKQKTPEKPLQQKRVRSTSDTTKPTLRLIDEEEDENKNSQKTGKDEDSSGKADSTEVDHPNDSSSPSQNNQDVTEESPEKPSNLNDSNDCKAITDGVKDISESQEDISETAPLSDSLTKDESKSKPEDLQIPSLQPNERLGLLQSLASFWADRSATGWKPLDYPLSHSDHLFPESDVIVREDEPSSLIAFCLSYSDYKERLNQMRQQSDPTEDIDLHKDPNAEMERHMLKKTGTHLKYQFQERSAKISCKIFYAEQFDAIRRQCASDEAFIQSLSRCVKWDSSGGKSGSAFLKTLDDRFVIKQLSQSELDAFIKFAPSYFGFMAQAFFHDLPTALAKIFGFYQIQMKNPITHKTMKMDVLVMENLFYNRKTSRIFDLKGSMRNRHVQQTGRENEVLLDENMVEYIYESPLFVRNHSKTSLRLSVFNDTLFLAKMNVMDYSLVIGIDDEKQELVVGIIDFIRTFTWDKKLESWVKERGLVGGGVKEPTVVSPRQYKFRFREAMERYVMMVPDCWHPAQKNE